ncbi:hypothetical protein Scep_018552 [Stephania cephalantha]|uniref:Uncharacterized protein n=1 Tax=Stephania cephalantha TaxID=152367 RepID=A0AAP0I9G9_9MAGN
MIASGLPAAIYAICFLEMTYGNFEFLAFSMLNRMKLFAIALFTLGVVPV